MQPAFEVGEAQGDRLDALLVGQVLHALLAHLVGLVAVEAGLFGFEVELLQLVVGNLEKVAQLRVGGGDGGRVELCGRAHALAVEIH